MISYETIILSIPETTVEEIDNLEKSLNKIINDNKGIVLSFDRWGKIRLAYPIRKNIYGFYFLLRFELNEDSVSKVFEAIALLFKLKLNDLVVRYMHTKIDGDINSPYKRPVSVESLPAKDVDSFLKENKMSGLLSSIDSKKENKDLKKEKDS